ncbi:hypothetical protein AB0B38_16880 [Streptomyces eurythermus]
MRIGMLGTGAMARALGEQWERVGHDVVAAERIAAAGPAARVVKAFDLWHESVWRLTPPVFAGRPLAVPLCGDDADALAVVRRLVRLWVGEGADAQAIAPPPEFAGVSGSAARAGRRSGSS